MIKNPLLRILFVMTILIAASLACSVPTRAPTLPPTAQPLTSEQIQDLESQIKATLQSPDASGDISITLTQDQINGMIVNQIAQQPDQGITDPSVVLTGGNLEVYGKVAQNSVSANLKAVMQPQVDADGNPSLHIVSINLGGLPVPDVLNARIETMANNAMNNFLDTNTNSFKVKTITITEGQMTITGNRQ